MKQFLRGLLIPLALLLCFFATLPVWAQQATPELVERSRPGVAQVCLAEVGSGESRKQEQCLGTAFLIGSDCTFLTAKHMLRNSEPERLVLIVQTPDSPETVAVRKARVLATSDDRDLALLRIDTVRGKPCSANPASLLSIHTPSAEFLAGEEVLVIGYPVLDESRHLHHPIARAGIVASGDTTHLGQPMIILDLIGVPGFSGSPVLLVRTGKAIGVVYGPGPTKRGYGFEWATPVSLNDLENLRQEH